MNELLSVNVNSHTEKKNGLTYLSWAWAWAEVLKHDPQATWVTHTYGPPGAEEPCMRVGKTAMVHVSVTVKGLRRECMLPVMDHRNKAIPEPDAFQVNTAIMRCLAKAIAMHGLGLYIYAGEDLPEVDKTEDKPKTIERKDAGGVIKGTDGAMERLTVEEREYIQELAADALQAFEQSPANCWDRIDAEGLEQEQKIALWTLLPSNVRSALKRETEARKATA